MSNRHDGAAQSAAPSEDDEVVRSLAALAGIAVHWVDAYDQPQSVSPASLRAILAALGLPCDNRRQGLDSMARWRHCAHAARLPPLITACAGQPIVLPAQTDLPDQPCLITLETGEQLQRQIRTEKGRAPRIEAVAPFGYHRLAVGDNEVTLAVAPPRCFGMDDARADPTTAAAAWGLALQLYGVRSAGDGGIGNFTGLATFAVEAGAHGASALALSPVHAMFAADARVFSPYSPSSRLFLNVLHIDPASILGTDAVALVLNRAGPEITARHQRLAQARRIDWPEAGQHRMFLLRQLHALWRMQPQPAAELAAFRLNGGRSLHEHATFDALHHWLRGNDPLTAADWRCWPTCYRQPDTQALRAFSQEQAGEIDLHVFLQWQAARGLRAAQQAARDSRMAVGLITDLAVGASNGGSQAWSHGDEMLAGVSVGAPPDLLNTRGQNWGIGAFSPLALRASGFRSYIAMLRAVMAHAGGLRIDHVLGLARLWLAPEGAEASEGAYLRYPQQDLMRLIALESWRHRTIVIGENLGTVPAGFNAALAEAGMLGIGALWFNRQAKHFLPPQQWQAHAIATTSTHDLPTVAGWWRGTDIGWRSQLDLLQPGERPAQARAQRADDRRLLWRALSEARCVDGPQPKNDSPQAVADGAIRYIAQTPAPLALLPLEDLLGLDAQPNLPGAVEGHPNWQRRMPGEAAALLRQPVQRQRMAVLAQRGKTAQER